MKAIVEAYNLAAFPPGAARAGHIALLLRDGSFRFSQYLTELRSGRYRHPCVIKVVEYFFKPTKGLAILFPSLFGPRLPFRVVALACTAVM